MPSDHRLGVKLDLFQTKPAAIPSSFARQAFRAFPRSAQFR